MRNEKEELAKLFEAVASEFIAAAFALRHGAELDELGELGLSTYWIEAQGALVDLWKLDNKKETM